MVPPTGFWRRQVHGAGKDEIAARSGATTFSYDLRLALDTGFTGKDLLRTRLRSGNMNNIYGAVGPIGLFGQEYGVDCCCHRSFVLQLPDRQRVHRCWWPRVRMDDMLPVWPSAYPSDMTMDFFTPQVLRVLTTLTRRWCWYLLADRWRLQHLHQLPVHECQRWLPTQQSHRHRLRS